jgi:hypothetical protein
VGELRCPYSQFSGLVTVPPPEILIAFLSAFAFAGPLAMSAFDIPEIVLGALPLIIEGLEAYSHSWVGKMYYVRRERKEFLRRLREAQTGLHVEIGKLCRKADA